MKTANQQPEPTPQSGVAHLKTLGEEKVSTTNMKRALFILFAIIVAASVAAYADISRKQESLAHVGFREGTYHIQNLIHYNMGIKELYDRKPIAKEDGLICRLFTASNYKDYLQLYDNQENSGVTEESFRNWRKNLDSSSVYVICKYILSFNNCDYVYYVYKNVYAEGFLLRGVLLKFVDGNVCIASSDERRALSNIALMFNRISADGLMSLLGSAEAYKRIGLEGEESINQEYIKLKSATVLTQNDISGELLMGRLSKLPTASDTINIRLQKALCWEVAKTISLSQPYKGVLTEKIRNQHKDFIMYLESVHCTPEQIDNIVREIVSQRYMSAADKLQEILKLNGGLATSRIINQYYPNAIKIFPPK